MNHQFITIEKKPQKPALIRLTLRGSVIQRKAHTYAQVERGITLIITEKIERLIAQRKRQVAMGYTLQQVQGLQTAFARLEYRLASTHKWQCNNLDNHIRGLLPDLHIIAPYKGKYAPIWNELLANLEMIAEAKNIHEKVKALWK